MDLHDHHERTTIEKVIQELFAKWSRTHEVQLKLNIKVEWYRQSKNTKKKKKSNFEWLYDVYILWLVGVVLYF